MHEPALDDFDIAILHALQSDSTLTNADLGARVALSASQCSRRRMALERRGIIRGYAARLDAEALGFGFRAITRVNLQAHGQDSARAFARFVAAAPQIRSAHSVSGDADYVLDIRTRDLAEYAAFIHERLLPFEGVAQVRSDIVLKTLKADEGVPLGP